MKEGKPQLTGHVGAEVTEEQANDAARQCALQALAVLRDGLDGDLSRLKRIVKLEVFVAAVPGFTGQPQVANGASELLGQVLGDAGLHARVAVGVTDLPLGVPVEVVVTAEVG
jgi:enamine deaminase RidA (YjgF/YER057c/UK114 family)